MVKNIVVIGIFAFVVWVFAYVGSAFLSFLNSTRVSGPVVSLEGIAVGTVLGLLFVFIQRRRKRSQEPLEEQREPNL